MLRLLDPQFDPAYSHDSPEVSVGEDGKITLQRPEPANQPICTFGNLGGRFTAGTSVSKHIPAWPHFANIICTQPLIIAVVPLRQVRLNFPNCIQSGQLTCSPCALERTGEHMTEPHAPKALGQFAGVPFALLCQRNVGSTRMLAGERPRCFPVSNQI